MYYACPKCDREFGEGGFCPYDGTGLAPTDAKTVAEVAASPADNTDDLSTSPDLGSGTLAGSAVANVLRGVLDERKSERRRAPTAEGLVGAVLDGRYRVDKLIGEGGMGMVFLGTHVVIEKKVAIKVLRAEVAADEAVTKRFVQEARAASRIGHPNIVDVTDFGTTKAGLTYQVMEFLEGRTLTDLIAKVNPLPLARVLGIIAQMCRALGAAHDKGIVHRDLKPDNIFLVDRDGRDDFVKVVDFGIAKVPPREDNDEARLTQVGTVFGTPEYMSPEQASGRADVDLRADVYAVGTILYEMLVGSVPHKGETTVRTLAMQILDDPPRPREAKPDLEISDDLENVVMRALEKERDKRFQSMQELLDALEDATSKTELDLPLLLKQERISAQQVQQNQYDTIPDVDVEEEPLPSRESQAVTSVRDIARSARATGSNRAKRRSRVTDPVFLRRSGSASVPLLDPLDPEETGPIPSQRSNLGIVVVALLLVGGIVGAFLLMRRGDEEPAALASIDASGALAALGSADAQAVEVPIDASITIDTDAATKVRVTGTKNAIKNTKSNPTNTVASTKEPTNTKGTSELTPKGMIEVKVITDPDGGRLIIRGAHAGPSGTHINRKYGEERTVKCRLEGYLDGEVHVKFDGKKRTYVCELRKKRQERCVEGVKNPFFDCP